MLAFMAFMEKTWVGCFDIHQAMLVALLSSARLAKSACLRAHNDNANIHFSMYNVYFVLMLNY